MTRRIPLWVDLRHVPVSERDAYKEAATDVGAERIIDETSDPVDHIVLRGAADQQTAKDAVGPIIVDCPDWSIIPLENLVAARRDRPGTLFALARSPEEAARFRHVLDVGVHGIALVPATPSDVQATADVLVQEGTRDDDTPNERSGAPALVSATVVSIEDAGMAERVCIDCTERFQDGEGLLVGSTSTSFALMHAETIDTELAPARPFRVNAGAVHCYLLAPGDRTMYLAEVAARTPVLALHHTGTSRTLQTGRAKIEHRPHARVTWCTDQGEGNMVVQWAETIRFIRTDGSAVAVTDLQDGDTILVHDAASPRHMGMPVKERSREQ